MQTRPSQHDRSMMAPHPAPSGRGGWAFISRQRRVVAKPWSAEAPYTAAMMAEPAAGRPKAVHQKVAPMQSSHFWFELPPFTAAAQTHRRDPEGHRGHQVDHGDGDLGRTLHLLPGPHRHLRRRREPERAPADGCGQ